MFQFKKASVFVAGKNNLAYLALSTIGKKKEFNVINTFSH
jgi:hypothetical protein